jgi:hypothetical protein
LNVRTPNIPPGNPDKPVLKNPKKPVSVIHELDVQFVIN